MYGFVTSKYLKGKGDGEHMGKFSLLESKKEVFFHKYVGKF